MLKKGWTRYPIVEPVPADSKIGSKNLRTDFKIFRLDLIKTGTEFTKLN